MRHQIKGWCLTTTGIVLFYILAGCAAPADSQNQIGAAYLAFEQNRYAEASQAADRVLASGNSSGAAEAHYLKGRIAEKQAQQPQNAASAQRLLQDARNAYSRALSQRPSPQLEASIRTQIANVAYFQEDYVTAAREGAAAASKLAEPTDRAWALYRAALSRQRLGQFREADQLFAQVQHDFPGTTPAVRAAQHAGARAFHIRVATFSNVANAERSMSELRAQRFPVVRSADATGKQIVSVGPLRTYQEAKQLQARLASRYHGTMIVP